jgi:periplasmic protein CpxP/Spy
MLRSTQLVLATVAAILALPAAASAQAPQPPAATAPPAGTSSTSPHAVPGSAAAQRVEEHIRTLHGQLRITSAEQQQWEKFAEVMRENGRAMDQMFLQRIQQIPTMNAVQNMQSYAQMAEAHADHVQKLAAAFVDLYNAMPEQQQELADQVFRASAESNAQRRMQTGRNEVR